ncbi:hypothetical protein INT45_013586 [Circinella minor]|uniref:CCHC-type domain-containing protein n=1 Tax=Circinella minor TaxID=1195481 RepID=A0A8H7RF84_9FUNG|nr:hypothetical protein INT45_013586 [Circinella minor]
MPEIEKGSRYNMPKVSKFEKGDDPDQWIQMYQDAAQVGSSGTNEVKLRMVLRYLNQSVRKWFYNQEFKLWSEFVEEFTSCFQNRKKIKNATKKLRNITRKKNEDLNDFLDRFDDLRRRHQKEAVLYEDVSIIQDRELCEIFIKAQPNKVMRKFVRNTGPTTLKQAKVAVKDYLYADSSDEENSDSSYTTSSSSDKSDDNTCNYTSDSSDSDTRKSRRKRSHKKKKTHRKIHTKNKIKEGKVTQGIPDPIDQLTKQISNLSLLVNEKQVQTTKTAENDRVQKLFDQVNHLTLMISGNEEELKDTIKNQEKPKETLLKQDKLDTLIGQITNLVTVLTDKQIKPNNQATASDCFNCKGVGHHAAECKAACKICKGMKTPHHSYYNCPDNKRNKEPINSMSYLVSVTNDKDQRDDNQKLHDADDESEELLPVENNLAAFKRGRENGSQEEQLQEKPKKLRNFVKEATIQNNSNNPQTTQFDQPMKEVKTNKTRTKIHQEQKGYQESSKILEGLDRAEGFSIPGDHIKAADIANAKVFKCSLNQLNNSVSGFRTDLKRLATRKQKRKPKGIVDAFWTKTDEPPDITGYGAPRTDVIIQGSIQTDGVLDCGSVGCLMSAKMARKLGFVNLEPSPMTHGMADGRKVDAVGYVQSVQLAIKQVSITVDAVVFDQSEYDFLVGRRALHKFQLFTDWGSYNWWIQKKHSIEPLLVTYEGVRKPQFINVDGNWEDETTEEYDLESNEESEESPNYSSYLVIPTGFSIEAEEEENQSCLSAFEIKEDKQEDATSQDIWLEIQNSIKNCNLIEEETDKLTDLLWRYQDVFGVDYKDLTQTSILEFHVDTGDANPIMHRPNRFMSHAELDQLRQEINEMVQQGILIPATHVKGPEGQRAGGWSFPALYVKKKTGERRLCVQFQKLNEVTVRDPWPLPVISDLLESYN